MAVASAGPYASLHLAPDRQPDQHPTTLFYRPDAFLPPNQQHQSTEGRMFKKIKRQNCKKRHNAPPSGNATGHFRTKFFFGKSVVRGKILTNMARYQTCPRYNGQEHCPSVTLIPQLQNLMASWLENASATTLVCTTHTHAYMQRWTDGSETMGEYLFARTLVLDQTSVYSPINMQK